MALPIGFPNIDFNDYHRSQLPTLLSGPRAAYVARASANLSSLAMRLPSGDAYTYEPSPQAMKVVAGDARAATVLELDLEAWQGLVHELEAPAGLLYGRRVRSVRGNAVDFMAWESVLRAMYNGRPPYDPAHLDLRDLGGQRLDTQYVYRLDDERAAMQHFLGTAGYLFVRDVFGIDEVERMRVESDQLAREARPGDKLSWWGKNAAGEEVLCRVTRGCSKPSLATLPGDVRLAALKDLAADSLVHRRGEGQGVTVIYKNPAMIEGLGDLPWHRDCGMGGHAVMCPVLVVSIFLSESCPDSGELAFLPGSKDAAFNAHDAVRDDLPLARFHAQAGDVSLHFSDTVHAAPPPRSPHRRQYRISAVVDFARPQVRHHRGEGSYNDVLHQRADGQVEHLVDVAKRG